MPGKRHDFKTGQVKKSAGAGGSSPDSRDLTCNEAQVEELLAEGESTEGDVEEGGHAGKRGMRKPVR